MKQKTGWTRRNMLAAGGTAALGFTLLPSRAWGATGQPPPSGRLNIGCVGVGGQGGGVTGDLASLPNVHIAALCDVNADALAHALTRYPDRPCYRDYRVMLEKEKGLDALMIATPDHTHAPVALMAMRRGKHVYVEKPMCHTIEEARLMGKVAAETRVVTQMGNQGHAGEGLRLTKEWIDAGAIGTVREAHSWSDRPGRFWNTQGRRFPTDTPPVPASLDWDLWQGPAAARAYHPDIAPGKWRGWFDYGCGALGDMMVHNADPAWYVLGLGAPDAVEAQTSETNPDSFPLWCVVTWHFGARGSRGPVKVIWHDGGKMPPPPPGFEPDRKLDDNGIYFVGDKGVILCGGWSGAPRLVPESAMQAFTRPAKTIPRSVGHRREWVDACIAGKPQDAKAGFWYSAPFTEALLVGVLPIRLGKRIEWDTAAMRAKNAPEAAPLIRKAYRKGFELTA